MNALAEVGSTAYTSGASLQQVEGYITSIAVATGQSGDEIGNALRSMMARLYKIGSEGIDAAGKPEKMLKEMGVAVRDGSGQFRDFGSVLDDLSVKWKTMSNTEKIATAQQVAGIQRYNQFMSLMNNYKMATDATTTALNSQGSAQKENEIHMQSAQAKLQVLKTTAEEFWLKAINSDVVIGAIEGLTNLINTFGNLPSAVMLSVTALALFKGQAIAGAIAGLGSFVTSLISAISFSGGLKIAIGELNIAFASNPIGMATLAISAFIGGMVALSSSIETTKDKVETLTKSAENLSTITSTENLVNKYKTLQATISDTNTPVEKLTQAKKELLDVQRQLAQQNGELISGYDNEGKAVADNLELIEKKLSEDKTSAIKEAQDNYQKVFNSLNKKHGADPNKGLSYLNPDNTEIAQYIKLSEKQSAMSEKQKKQFDSTKESLEEMNKAVLLTQKNGGNISGMKLFDFDSKSFVDATAYMTKLKLEAQNVGKKPNGLDSLKQSAKELTDGLKNAGDEINKLGGSVDIIDKVEDEMSKYGGITQDTYSNLLSKYPEVFQEMAKDGDMTTNLNNLKAKYQQQQKGQLDQAWITAKGEQQASNETLTNDINNYNESADTKINLDSSKKVSNAELVNFIMSSESAMTNAQAGNYGVDAQNWANYLNDKIQTYDEYTKQILLGATAVGEAVGGGVGLAGGGAFTSMGLSGVGGGRPNLVSTAPNIVSSGDAKDIDKANKEANKKAQETIQYIDTVTDRYYELNNAIDTLNDSVDYNDTIGENKTGQEKINLLNQQIGLYNQLIQAQGNLKNAEQSRLWELRQQLAGRGIEFDGSGNMTNSQAVLENIKNYYNSMMNGSNDSDLKKQFDSVKGLVDEYNTLARDKIPSATKAIVDMSNKIYSAQKSISDEVKKQRDDFIKAEQDKTNATKKEIEKRKKALQDSKNNQDEEDELNNKQKALDELQSKLEDALRTGDAELIKEARKQMTDAQNELSKYINDKEYDKSIQRLDDESTYVDESSQSKIDNINKQLSDENILKLVQQGVTNIGSMLNNVKASTADLPKSFNEVGSVLNNTWLPALMKANEMISNMKGITMGIDANLNTNTNLPSTNKAKEPIVVKIEYGDINIKAENGTEIRSEVEDMLEKNNKEIYKIMSEVTR